jgi:anhydro-N-acetylmuramic acid kinase
MNIVGIMSGTSMDGMDIVLCRFIFKEGRWTYQIVKAETIDYDNTWRKKLSSAQHLNGEDLILLHNDFGSFTGKAVKKFLGKSLKADLVASHGHTIFHQPGKKMTFQLGNAPYIASECSLPVISDFRTPDVASGGQGAPLVPVGDKLLFAGYDFCLNLGGFANISTDVKDVRIACDLCPVNIVANELAQRIGAEYDAGGMSGRNGKLIPELTHELNNLEFYSIKGPKSLGREWVEITFMPVLNKYKVPVEDLLKSFYEHVAIQISNYINSKKPGKVLVTGGGAFNLFLVELLRAKSNSELIIPDDKVVKYKEAIVFAFLGLLRYQNQVNILASVTGASRDSSGGGIYIIPNK